MLVLVLSKLVVFICIGIFSVEGKLNTNTIMQYDYKY
jgi:hypothetical protein